MWEWAEGDRGSGFRLLLKACRCFTSSLTTSTCSSVGLNDSWIQSKKQEDNKYDVVNVQQIIQENYILRSEIKIQEMLSSFYVLHCSLVPPDFRQACCPGQAALIFCHQFTEKQYCIFDNVIVRKSIYSILI